MLSLLPSLLAFDLTLQLDRGTTLVKWVRLMAWKHGKNFTKDEGPVFDHEMFEGNDRVLLVTSLRPPTDRGE